VTLPKPHAIGAIWRAEDGRRLLLNVVRLQDGAGDLRPCTPEYMAFSGRRPGEESVSSRTLKARVDVLTYQTHSADDSYARALLRIAK
jgi:hypothetical protein